MPGGNQIQPSDDLEAKARDFLFSDELADKNADLAKRFDLKEKAQDDLAAAQNAVVFKEMSLPDFIDTVKRIAVLNKKSSADLVSAVTASFLLPLDEYLDGEPKKLLEKNKPASSSVIPPLKRISVPPVVIREAVPRPREHTDLTKMTAAPEKAVLRSPVPRLVERPETRLTSPAEPKFAGFINSTTPLPAKSKLTTDWLRPEKLKKSEPKRSLQATSYKLQASSGKPLTEAEDQELKTIKERTADLPRQSGDNEKLVEQILAAVQFPFKDDIQKTRFINAIKNRMRDIRDQFETKELLLRSENLGGVGLSEPVAEQAVKVIEKIVGEQNRRQGAAKKEEFQMFDAQTKAASVLKTQSRTEQVAAEQDARYKNLVSEKIKSILERPLGFLKKKEMPTLEEPEIMMSKKESASLDSARRAKMTVPLTRPKMEDIKFSPTLVGPIEELKNFTLRDWQALGAKASVISQKLAVVRNESYTKYQTGLAAFKESPLFALAQEILDESLAKNMPLAGLIELRKKENKPYLSENEIGDIMNID